jgi:hypothetical protein
LQISFVIVDPEFPVGFDSKFTVLPIVTMPESAVYKDDQLVFFQANFRFPISGFSRDLYRTPVCHGAFLRSSSGQYNLPQFSLVG